MTVSECCLIKLLPYILYENYINILALEMASQGAGRHCASCIGTLSFPIVSDAGWSSSSSGNGHVVWRRRLLDDAGGGDAEAVTVGDAPTPPSTVAPTPSATLWFVQLVVGNCVVFALCVVLLLLYIAAVVARTVLHSHALWGPVRRPVCSPHTACQLDPGPDLQNT